MPTHVWGFNKLSILFFAKKRPGCCVVLFAVGFEEGGVVVDGAFLGAGGLGGVGPGFADGAGGLVGDVVPAVDGGAIA